jgi:hypothetical protein
MKAWFCSHMLCLVRFPWLLQKDLSFSSRYIWYPGEKSKVEGSYTGVMAKCFDISMDM